MVVTVIIPLYNRAELVQKTIESVFRSSSRIVLQVIVVDDGSDDGGVSQIQTRFPQVKIICNERNIGAAASRNIGLSSAQGDFVLFLDSDDLIEPDFFKEKLDVLIANPNLDGAYGPWDYFESDGIFLEEYVKPRHSKYPIYDQEHYLTIIENLLAGWYIPINAFLWRRDALRSVGGFTPTLSVNQDLDLCFRLLLRRSVQGVSGGRALIRVHQGERVGTVSSAHKLKEMLSLRKAFVSALIAHKLWRDGMAERLARFSFGIWAQYRGQFRAEADAWLQYSNELFPELQLLGGRSFRFLAGLVGNKNAVLIKDVLRRFALAMSLGVGCCLMTHAL